MKRYKDVQGGYSIFVFKFSFFGFWVKVKDSLRVRVIVSDSVRVRFTVSSGFMFLCFVFLV